MSLKKSRTIRVLINREIERQADKHWDNLSYLKYFWSLYFWSLLPNNFDMKDEEFSSSIKYADDSTLLTLDFEKLQVATLELQQACLKWSMKINFDKCKVLTPSNDNIVIHGELLENVNNFIYLGSSVPDTTKDIERRIALAPTAFGRLRKSIWSKRDILLKLKLRLYRALILPIATCASETWA